MKIRYYLQKLFGQVLDTPFIPEGKTVGYSLVRSEKGNVVFGKHTKVYSPFFLQRVELGDYSYIARNSSISNCVIGKFCSIGPNFCCGLGLHPIDGISTSPMFYSTQKQNGISLCKKNRAIESRQSIIGNDVFIGANVTLLDGIIIGDGAVIGAGAVVTKDIPPYAVAVGVPARIVKYRFDNETIVKLEETCWWDGDMHVLKEVADSFEHVDVFLNRVRDKSTDS